MRKLATLIALLAIISLALPSAASAGRRWQEAKGEIDLAHSIGGGSHTYWSCSGGDETGGIVIRRGSTVVGRINGGKAKLVPRNLRPCFDGNGSNPSLSLILPINIQGHGTDDQWQFLQFGIGRHNYTDGHTGCGNFLNDVTMFVWTPDANTGGNLCGVTWWDPDNNGNVNLPHMGHDYTMSVEEYNASGNDYWRFCMDDLDDAWAGDCSNISRLSADGGLYDPYSAFWTGCEVKSRSHAIGVQYGESGSTIHEMAYRKASNNTYYYTEDSVPVNAWGSWGANLVYPNYYNPGQSQNGTGEQLNCFTDPH